MQRRLRTGIVAIVAIVATGLSLTAAAVDVPVTVKESAGASAADYPTTVVVPLPYGQYQDLDSFSLGVPAQFQVLNRWATRDNSIRHVLAHFQSSVGPLGDSVYHIRDTGANPAPASPVSVSQDADFVTVDTGPLKFTVSKSAFTILDTVWLDRNGDGTFASSERMIVPDASHGGVLDGCRISGGSCVQDIQRDREMPAPTITIEESGPLRVVIRAERPATYVDTNDDGLAEDHDHGYAVRIFAFAGKSFVKVDYQLQNSAKGPDLTDDKHADPLYFDALNLDFNLELGASTVTVGREDGTFYTQSLGNGLYLAQELHDEFTIRNAVNGTALEPTCSSSDCKAPGFIDVSDGSGGVTAVVRNFWQLWPNGLRVDSNKKLQIQLWPKWSAHYYERDFSSSGLYWLKDMQHAYKETLLYFHGPGTTGGEMLELAKTFQYHPVPTLPVSWYKSTGVTVNLEGKIPMDSDVGTGKRVPTYSGDDIDENDSGYKLGWTNFWFRGPKLQCNSAGGWPASEENFIATEDPADYWDAEASAIGEINVRPESMADYSYEDDWNRLQLSQGYGNNHWRADDEGTYDLSDSGHDTCARDDQHGWFYIVEQAYHYTGNPWVKDWFEFVGEFRKPMLDDRSGGSYGENGRGRGHPLSHILQAYRVTNDTEIIDKFKVFMRETLIPLQNRYYGLHQREPGAGEAAFSTGYLARAVVDYMTEIRNSDPQAYAEAFSYLSGLMEWNLHWSNFGYWEAPGILNYSAGPSLTFVDPQSWYYWNSGRQEVLDHLQDYLEDRSGPREGIPDGFCNPVPADPPYDFCYGDSDCPGSTCKLSSAGGQDPYGTWSSWKGQYESRYWHYVQATTRIDNSPPAAVTNLSAAIIGSNVSATWTAPTAGDLERYHLVWSTRPISWEHTQDDAKTNWWAANAVGPALVPQPGAAQGAAFNVAGASPVYVAMFSFDENGNMSPMSNVTLALVGGDDDTPPSVPTNLNATAQSTSRIDLTWNASSDPESGILEYRVYRDSIRIAVTGAPSFSDTDLAEATAYSYTVSAVNGALQESAQSAPVIESTLADTTPPTIVSVDATSATTVRVVFSEPVGEAGAETVGNYALDEGATIGGAALASDLVTVTLITSPMSVGTEYTLTVGGVEDRAATPNPIAPGTTATFVYTAVVTLEIRIAAGGDDIEEEPGGSVWVDSLDLELGYEGGEPQTVGLRFVSVPVPHAAEIRSASIQFEVDATSADSSNLTIQGEDSNSAAPFGTVISRPRTSASVAWSPPAWNSTGAAGPDQETADIATVLQEIVNRPGWTPGNALVLILEGTGTRTAVSYDGDSAGAPLLRIEYTDVTATEPPPPPQGLEVD